MNVADVTAHRGVLVFNLFGSTTLLSVLPWLTASRGAYGAALALLAAHVALSVGAALHFVFTKSPAKGHISVS
ncbi:hypothetical protein [Mycolicibacterium hodleri]|uniref:hypothetical protein n=1 Tax=Mycolicibacterium hodleri TaxID=49897 RepID=UPI001375C6C6|nr:hypothetical protein [Mycolicibacterium hodleri]